MDPVLSLRVLVRKLRNKKKRRTSLLPHPQQFHLSYETRVHPKKPSIRRQCQESAMRRPSHNTGTPLSSAEVIPETVTKGNKGGGVRGGRLSNVFVYLLTRYARFFRSIVIPVHRVPHPYSLTNCSCLGSNNLPDTVGFDSYISFPSSYEPSQEPIFLIHLPLPQARISVSTRSEAQWKNTTYTWVTPRS